MFGKEYLLRQEPCSVSFCPSFDLWKFGLDMVTLDRCNFLRDMVLQGSRNYLILFFTISGPTVLGYLCQN